MNGTQNKENQVVCRKPRAAGFLLGLFLFVLAMANFEALHHFFHAESETESHQCAVTLLSNGQVDIVSSDAAILETSTLVTVSALPKTLSLISADYSLLPGCGPPSLL